MWFLDLILMISFPYESILWKLCDKMMYEIFAWASGISAFKQCQEIARETDEKCKENGEIVQTHAPKIS